MGDPGQGADPTLENEQYVVDAAYHSDSDDTVSAVWLLADRVRALLKQKTHDRTDREDLEKAVVRQLRTAVLYQVIGRVVKATSPANLTMYVLLFPGQARDNTGLKDLNDNVLGYTLQQQYTARRQREIERIFHPQFVVVGQDFKLALFLTWEQTRAEFDKRLHELDKALRKILLEEFLPRSDKDGAKQLKRVLEKDPDYRFDVYYGTNSLGSDTTGADLVPTMFTLLTQALKGAAIARYVTKSRRLTGAAVKQFGKNASPDKKVDPRGKAFAHTEFLNVARTAPGIKAFMVKAPQDQAAMLEYNVVYVDTVWTVAFFRQQNLANRDVIRDVRKSKLYRDAKTGRLVAPPRPNVKYTYKSQVQLLELWVVVVNVIDFVKDFLVDEMSTLARQQHDLAVDVLDNLRDSTKPVDTRQAETFLTRDLRQRQIAVLGTTSEFQFFAGAADYPARILFMMDVRDVGVETAMIYDATTAKILDDKLSGPRLMEETIRSTEPIIQMQRFTYDLVAQVLGRYHQLLKHSAALKRTDGSKEAARAYKKSFDAISDFEQDVQILLGGDEVMVACHPRFAAYVHNIVAELAETFLGPGHGRRMGMRAGVAFSLAKTAGDRKQHQLAHDQAMRLADEQHGLLKDLERRQRRMERLLEMLERNPKKSGDAPKYRKTLDQLQLRRHFVRVMHANPTVLPAKRVDALVTALRDGKIPTRDGNLIQVVDFDGNVVDYGKLQERAKALEEAIRAKVGRDNVHIDTPPAVKNPFGDGDDEDDDGS